MLITVFLVIGYAFNYSHASITSLPFPFSNKSFETNHFFRNRSSFDAEALHNGYVKLRPGSKIYFYTTEDENLLIGPKLQSEDDVGILLLDQDEDLKKYSQFKNYLHPYVYSVLKSGVLVPKHSGRRHPQALEECNKCVYQSVKPTYYIKGFKKILIPVDILYSKSKQEELFNSENLKPDSWRTDLKLPGLKGNSEEDFQSELIQPKTSNWSPVKTSSLSRSSPANLIAPESEHPSISDEDVSPDKNCNGDVTLFVLENNGVFKRMPSDPFLPLGMHLSYSLLQNLMLKPKFLQNSGVELSYVTGQNGDLIPHAENTHKIVAEEGNSVSFILSKTGGLIPVKEEKDENEFISYYFNGNLVHKSHQFKETFSNSTSILFNNKKVQIFERMSNKENKSEPTNRTKAHHLQKRSAFFPNYERNGCFSSGPHTVIEHGEVEPPIERVIEYEPAGTRNAPTTVVRQALLSEPPVIPNHKAEVIPSVAQSSSRKVNFEDGSQGGRNGMYSHPPPPHPPPPAEPYPEKPPIQHQSPEWENAPLRPRTDVFTFDEKGTRIRLIPEITDNNDVVIYKLTCKGNLVRYPSCKEPEFGFSIHFQVLLDEFVLVPRIQDNKPFVITYILQENGDLVPSEGNANTFRKAPGSLIYFMLGKNNVLFPVQQIIDLDGNVSFFYQDHFILKMKDSTDKPLHFSTKGAPLFAFFNGFTMITISSRPRLNPSRGSNWKQLKPAEAEDEPPKTMYLTGPKGELIKLAPYKNKQGSTVVYELDGNGIFYRSPKDKKKCIILRSYILLKEGILLPSNDTSDYVYMMSKNGDLFPYLYPDGKIEAPLASSLKYVLCEKGILLPIKLEIIDNYICYLFRDVIVYKERVYCKSCLDRMDEEQVDFTTGAKKSSCDVQTKEGDKRDKDIKLFINKDGEYVFYEKQDKILKRFPSEAVPAYLRYTMGSFEVKPDGSLHQIRYQDPNEYVVNLMLEPNGDLLEDTRNVNKVRSDYYILDAKGNLITVQVRKTKRNFHFYKNNLRLCRVPIPDRVKAKTEVVPEDEKTGLPFGKDPMGIMDDPIPEKLDSANDTRSLYIPIPLKSLSIADPGETCLECGDKKKYEMLKDTLKQVSKGTSLPLALELELTDEIMEELKNWASKCDKILTRREISDDIKKYLSNISFVGSKSGST